MTNSTLIPKKPPLPPIARAMTAPAEVTAETMMVTGSKVKFYNKKAVLPPITISSLPLLNSALTLIEIEKFEEMDCEEIAAEINFSQ